MPLNSTYDPLRPHIFNDTGNRPGASKPTRFVTDASLYGELWGCVINDVPELWALFDHHQDDVPEDLHDGDRWTAWPGRPFEEAAGGQARNRVRAVWQFDFEKWRRDAEWDLLVCGRVPGIKQRTHGDQAQHNLKKKQKPLSAKQLARSKLENCIPPEKPDVNKIHAIITCGDRKFWLSHTQAFGAHGISGDLLRLMKRVQIEELRALHLLYRTMTTKDIQAQDIAHHALGPGIVHHESLVHQENTTIDLLDWMANCPNYPTRPDAYCCGYAYAQKRGAPDPITDDAAFDRELPPSYGSPYADLGGCHETLRGYLPGGTRELIACSDRGFSTDIQAFISMRDHYFHYDASEGREFSTCLGPAECWLLRKAVESRMSCARSLRWATLKRLEVKRCSRCLITMRRSGTSVTATRRIGSGFSTIYEADCLDPPKF
ncbi:hypothetical protein FN846DRAFT_991625 [Sphaerosporella brunnea]|uniref:Uncharacterized protein n=1 Tax=Sphaerosporella brunnea TaxID=1250544 RepID=A0A5J5EP62_9PEZI|nr:hypothetical protein FN846DRAFT_991625 [Sphaerosporella brunnea]